MGKLKLHIRAKEKYKIHLEIALTSLTMSLLYHYHQLKDVLIDNKKVYLDYLLPTDDSNYYLKRITHYINSGLIGNPYFDSNEEYHHTYFLGEYLISRIMKFTKFDISITLTILNFFITVCIFILLGFLFYNKNRSVILSFAFISIIFFLQYPNILVRPVSPVIHLFIFLSYLTFEITKKESLINLMIKFALLIFLSLLYPYFFLLGLVYFTINGITQLFSGKREYLKLIKISLIVILVIIFFYQQFQLKEMDSEFLLRLGQTRLRWPTGIPIILYLVLAIIILYQIRNKIMTRKQELAKTFSLNLSLIIILISPILTSRELEFSGHYGLIGQIIFLLSINFIISTWRNTQYLNKYLRITLALFCLVTILNSQHSRSSIQISSTDSQDRKNTIAFVRNLSSANSGLIVAEQNNTEWLSIYTKNSFLWLREANLYPLNKEEILERYFLNEYLMGKKMEIQASNNRSLFGVKYIDQCLRIKNRNIFFISMLEKFKLPCSVEETFYSKQLTAIALVRKNHESLIRKYRVAILVLPNRNMNKIQNFNEVYRNQSYRILLHK